MYLPKWGGIYLHYRREMNNIKTKACHDMNLRKIYRIVKKLLYAQTS